MGASEDNLHLEFESPPVVEVALGIEFLPLASWSIPHFGLFWQQVRTTFPHFEVKDPVLTSNRANRIIRNFLPVRCWFMDQSGAQLLQIQDDRLVLNWRKVDAGTYPRYHTMRPQLEALWETFLDFLQVENIETPQVEQCEFTYVNHIAVRTLPGTSNRLADIFSFWEGGPTHFLEETGAVAFSSTVSLPGLTGQLATSFQPATRIADSEPLFQLTFTTRIRPDTSQTVAIFRSLDQGHDWDLRAFLEFTSQQAQASWGRSNS